MENSNGEKCINTSANQNQEVKPDVFKKPILIGKIGRLPKKLPPKVTENVSSDINTVSKKPMEPVPKEDKSVVVSENTSTTQPTEKSIPFPYTEPVWSGLPESNGKDYSFDVLRNGSIIENINLMNKSFWVFGRLDDCNIQMQHPTISRYHAVLQYRKEASETYGPGFYIYDLGSTHGTFLNKNRLKSKMFVRMQVGHILKLGCSTRSFILEGPEYDEEEESEFSVTELREKRKEEIRKLEEEAIRAQQELEKKKKREEERGVDWGLGEDADEETDLSENPYAQTNNEELYLDDPKKALRGFFEREGLEFEYNCHEQGIGQFLCKVELPVDDELGRPIVAEVLHKGKKKEAVIQCALEACRILDRYGVLRQATHESRKRKAKNWEENDYYDSDEDTFFDRTGTIEKKREKRMNAKAPQKVETYESLVEKEKTIVSSIKDLENQISAIQAKIDAEKNQDNDEDTLDSYMKDLKDSKPDKYSTVKLKSELAKLRTEHAKIVRLINIARPANLPPLVVPEPTPSTSKGSNASSLPMFGKRKKIQFKFGQKSKYELPKTNCLDDYEDKEIQEVKHQKKEENKGEEVKEPVSEEMKEHPEDNNANDNVMDSNDVDQEFEDISSSSSSSTVSEEESSSNDKSGLKNPQNTMTFKKFERILKKGLPAYAGKYQEKLEKILNNLKKLATNEDRMNIDWKILSAKKKKVMKLISDMKKSEPDEKLEYRISSDLNRIFVELNLMTDQKYKALDKVKKMGNEIQSISVALVKDMKDKNKVTESNKPRTSWSNDSEMIVESTEFNVSTASASNSKELTAERSTDTPTTSERLTEIEIDPLEETSDSDNLMDERKKKKNQRRIHQRQEKQEQERQRGYEEDASRENYSMWVPPSDQSGDGRTSLNDKYGY